MTNGYKESFEQIKIAGGLAASTLDEVTSYVKPGVTTSKLDKICYEFIRDNGGYSAPLFYRGFPKSCCTSPNHIVCHGIPTNKYLKEGDEVLITELEHHSNYVPWHYLRKSKGIKIEFAEVNQDGEVTIDEIKKK